MNRRFLLFTCIFGLLIIHGCKNYDELNISKELEMTGLAGPIVLQGDSTVITLSDYFRHPKAIDSIRTDSHLTYRFTPDSTALVLYQSDKQLPRYSVIDILIGGYKYCLLIQKSPKIWQHFEFDPKGKTYKKVQIAGDMNDWNPVKSNLKLKDKIWVTDLLFYPGRYQYKLVLDGKWTLDPGNPVVISNNIGGSNSVLKAGNINPPGAPILYTLSSEKQHVTIGIKNKAKEIFVFWENYLLDEKFWKVDSTGIQIKVPANAYDYDRSFMRVWAYNNSGISNDIIIPLANGKPITDVNQLTRKDKHAMILYFLMVDRFRDGDPKNNNPVRDKEISPKLNFQGGDFEGIRQKIDDGYFSNLGINTIWISPITQNPQTAWKEFPKPHRKFSGYHGYWPVTLSTPDPHFGTSEELKKLVAAAHDKNINILLDYVSNHVHQESWLFKQHPDWATPLILAGNRKNLRLWDEQRLTTWFDEFLPTLDLTKPEVCNMVSDSALFWIKEYEIDGFRHDATKHIPEVYWRTLTQKLNEQVVFPDGRPVYQIGETYGSRELIKSYINPGMLDGQFDFDIYFTGRTVFARDNESFKDLNYALQQSFNFYGDHSLMGYISGNQDQSRFISLASGALSFNEDDHEAGWKRNIGVKDTIGYNKLASFLAFNMTIPGVPVIYYGDEYGMPGANDPDNRRMMRFENLNRYENQLKSITQKLVNLRKNNLALLYGDFRTLEVTENAYVYMRTYFDKVIFVIFNKDEKPRKIDFELPERFINAKFVNNFGNVFTVDKGKVTMNMKGRSFEIIMN